MKVLSALCCTMALIGSIDVVIVNAQPGGPGGLDGVPSFPNPTGNSRSSACPKSSGTCSTTGSDAYAKWDVTYDTSTGKFTGSLTTSMCPPTSVNNMASATCTKQTLPDPTFTTTPKMMPLLGAIGFSLKGVMVSSPYENGFQSGFACTGGSCDGGYDIVTCEARLKQTCNNHVISHPEVLLDDCSGHASPYHIHKDLVCDYDESASTKHSPLVAVLLDGRGLYGMYEDSNGKPTDLDECGGHYGPVPSAKLDSDTTADAATNVYHYHTRDEFPFTAGCFGPLTTTTCKSLNSDSCGDDDGTALDIMVNGVTKSISYKKWCPCRSANPDALVATGGSSGGGSSTDCTSITKKNQCRRKKAKCKWVYSQSKCVSRT